jgi:tetratricopeptide (TPR) repeat protein
LKQSKKRSAHRAQAARAKAAATGPGGSPAASPGAASPPAAPRHEGRRRRFDPLDLAAATMVVAFAMAMVARPLPNLDLWWLLAVGRRIVETGAYIYQDPFSFTVAGAAWSPQAYASGILFYLLFKVGGLGAITVLRVLLVGTLTALTFRTLRRIGVAWALGAPLVLVALVNAHSRLTDRGQLFEYVFLAWLVGFLLTCHDRRGRSFFIAPVAVQLAWVQFHSSFLLGPVLAAIFFASEWVASRAPMLRPLQRHDWKRVGWLVALMALACAVNPNPKAFLVQPFDPAQREMLTRYTLEWKSPFDPAIAAGNFHPFYEVLLALAAIATLVRITRLPLAPVAMMAATAYLSLQSHRFRVEFALVAVPMIALLLKDAPLAAAARRVWPSRTVWRAIGLAIALSLVVAEHERAVESFDVPELYPDAALAFVVENDVAQRPFHSIGFGSYLLWDQYGRRRSFIDGRNFHPALYRDFLAAQTRETDLRAVAAKYQLDAFILPGPARSDRGLQNVHRWLIGARADWPLVYVDDRALVYAARSSADSSWIEAHALRHYHPMTLQGAKLPPGEFDLVVADLERLMARTPGYVQGWLDLGLARYSRGELEPAQEAFAKATVLDPKNVVAWNQLGHAARDGGRIDDAIAAYSTLVSLLPGSSAAHLYLAGAYGMKGDRDRARSEVDRALAIEPGNAEAIRLREMLK